MVAAVTELFAVIWACLLVLAFQNRVTRPFAVLFAMKWGANYAAAWAGFWTLPTFVDVAFGAVGIVMAAALPARIYAVVVAGFVLTPLVHAAHWALWLNGVHAGVQYYAAVLFIFTAQVSALAWPEARANVRAFLRRGRVNRRRAVAGSSRYAGREGSQGD